MTTDVTHHFKDPSKLTPYEKKLLDMRNQGMSYGQMSKALDGVAKPNTIATRFRIIREKLEVIEALSCEAAE